MKKTIKIVALFLCITMTACLMTGCYERTEETQYTDELKKQISDMYGFPDVSNFFEYSQLKEIYEMRGPGVKFCVSENRQSQEMVR